MAKIYYIVGKMRNTDPEIIDQFTNKDEAIRCLSEYKMAFGQGWTLVLASRKPKGA